MAALVECSCLLMGRFARSVWKTERLWVRWWSVLDCLWDASLAQFGKLSNYGCVGGVFLPVYGALRSLGLEN